MLLLLRRVGSADRAVNSGSCTTPKSVSSFRTALHLIVLVVPVVSALSAIHHAVVFGEKLECNDSVGTQ